MEVTTIGIKIGGAIALFVVTFIFTLLPNKLRKFKESQFKNITSFCGGLFLGLCFLHLIPDTLSEFKKLEVLENLQKRYPMAEFIIILGMIFVMSAEKFASIIQLKKERSATKKCDDSKGCCKKRHPLKDEEKTPLVSGKNNESYSTEKAEDVVVSETETVVAFVDEDDTQFPFGKNVKDGKERKNSTISSRQRKNVKLLRIRTVCLVIALMLHSLFEGLTVGLQTTTIGVVVLVALLTFHKCIIGFSLGITLVGAKSDWKTYLKKAIAFAISSPIGVFIGIIVCSANFGILNNEAVAILTAISTGTFFYITFFEMLGKCLAGDTMKDLISYACFLLGFVIFAGITIVPEMQL